MGEGNVLGYEYFLSHAAQHKTHNHNQAHSKHRYDSHTKTRHAATAPQLT